MADQDLTKPHDFIIYIPATYIDDKPYWTKRWQDTAIDAGRTQVGKPKAAKHHATIGGDDVIRVTGRVTIDPDSPDAA
jgi:hypothetical protein